MLRFFVLITGFFVLGTISIIGQNLSSAITFTRITEGDVVADSSASGGCSWIDYDPDDDLDLFVATGSIERDNLLYQNNGDGSFIKATNLFAATSLVSWGCSWGDYDNNGYPDLFVSNWGPDNFLYRNNGDGTFTKDTISVIANDGGGSWSCSWGDYNNDGYLDLFVANQQGNNFLYRNNGDGTFTKIVDGAIVNDGGESYGCSWFDYDLDGDLDLFVANWGDNNFLYQNNGDGTFTKITTGEIVNDGGNSVGSSCGDYDNDGDLDLFVANQGPNNFLYQNNGDGTFTRIITGAIVNDISSSWGSTWGDFDNDGDLDLFVANRGSNNFLYQNNGDNTFTKITTGDIVSNGGDSFGSCAGDYDNDGDLDLFVANWLNRENNFLYQNNGNNNHWINIKCIGTISNTTAIGSKVWVKANINGNNIWQLQEISGQSGSLSQNSLNAEFGLGDATIVDSVKVEWPSGIVQFLTDVDVDQFITIEEQNALLASINPVAPELTACEEAFYVPIIVGDTQPVSDLFGISFNLNYPTEYIDYVGAQLTDPENNIDNFLGNDLLSSIFPDDPNGVVSIAMSRKAPQGGVSGNGTIVWVKFISAGNILDPVDITWSLSDITAIDPSGNPILFQPYNSTTVLHCGCIVWPGDCNNDGTVAADDVLPIGLYFGTAGPQRDASSCAWEGQLVDCWDPEAATYADANGDGVVNQVDILCIGLNYGNSHSLVNISAEELLLTDAGNLNTLNTAVDTIQPVMTSTSNDSLVVEIQVRGAQDLFGISYEFLYHSDNFDIDVESAIAGPFMGADILELIHIDTSANVVSVGLSRKNGQGGVSGDGNLTSIRFKEMAAAPSDTQMTFALQNVIAFDTNGDSIIFQIEPDTITSIGSQGNEENVIPAAYAFFQNYPNPFNPATTIQFALPIQSAVTLKIYDILGQEVTTLVDNKLPAGTHKVVFDASNLPSGVYFYRLQANAFTQTRKLLLTK